MCLPVIHLLLCLVLYNGSKFNNMMRYHPKDHLMTLLSVFCLNIRWMGIMKMAPSMKRQEGSLNKSSRLHQEIDWRIELTEISMNDGRG
ncbi:hypothetical protein I314_05372 [Cryptococcus bacillisporus CA1873]|uniref:Uncharacterized protein n=1 Tax=Cryptococcus bacillisporus CA1873 TaxID=1296111 RepID=A0ABR5B5X3_CRYGA|nr:hypothetical protein I314_05372 [Cryptococcus bacillisporus CA1873]|eukprot:KIR58958.1 hypothetical protein I314_05372 [Cryptococcus gattii CA1873]